MILTAEQLTKYYEPVQDTNSATIGFCKILILTYASKLLEILSSLSDGPRAFSTKCSVTSINPRKLNREPQFIDPACHSGASPLFDPNRLSINILIKGIPLIEVLCAYIENAPRILLDNRPKLEYSETVYETPRCSRNI